MSSVLFITLDEFLELPERDDDQREELVDGEVVVSPGAKPFHAAMVDRLRHALSPLRQQGFMLANDFSCVLGGRSMPVPDLAAIRQPRWDKAVTTDDWVYGSPELVIEVASPGNRKLLRKAAVYIEHGAEQVWVVYPVTAPVTVVTSAGTIEVGPAETLKLHGVPVPVASIFPHS